RSRNEIREIVRRPFLWGDDEHLRLIEWNGERVEVFPIGKRRSGWTTKLTRCALELLQLFRVSRRQIRATLTQNSAIGSHYLDTNQLSRCHDLIHRALPLIRRFAVQQHHEQRRRVIESLILD